VVTRFVPSSRTVELVKNLGPKDLMVRLGGVPIALESAAVDGAAKRVAIILDARANLPNEEWKLEVEMATSFVTNARSEDRFALSFVGMDDATDSLLSSSEVAERLRNLSSARPATTGSSGKVYDTLFAAVNRLSPPEFGDALFLFGRPEDSGSKVDPDHLRELILKNRLRLYGVSFSDPISEQLPRGFNPNKPLPATVVIPKLDDMCAATGYFFSYHSVKSIMFPGQIPLFKNFLADLYAGIAEPYRLRIPVAGAQGPLKLELSVTNPKKRNKNAYDVHYPRAIYPYPPPSQTTP
jgi:hypothetical protein